MSPSRQHAPLSVSVPPLTQWKRLSLSVYFPQHGVRRLSVSTFNNMMAKDCLPASHNRGSTRSYSLSHIPKHVHTLCPTSRNTTTLSVPIPTTRSHSLSHLPQHAHTLCPTFHNALTLCVPPSKTRSHSLSHLPQHAHTLCHTSHNTLTHCVPPPTTRSHSLSHPPQPVSYTHLRAHETG